MNARIKASYVAIRQTPDTGVRTLDLGTGLLIDYDPDTRQVIARRAGIEVRRYGAGEVPDA